MIKLTDLLQEQDSFTAINKSSGNVTAFKSKDARDSAVKSGTHDKNKDSKEDEKDSNRRRRTQYSYGIRIHLQKKQF